jgi:hypothetical protein
LGKLLKEVRRKNMKKMKRRMKIRWRKMFRRNLINIKSIFNQRKMRKLNLV